MYLWDELLPQELIALKSLRTSKTCTNISAYAHRHGTYNLDTTPLAPHGVRALLYNDPDHRLSYGVHGYEAYYLGPALQHYPCNKCFVQYTWGTRICATAQFFQQMSQPQRYRQLLKY